MKMTKTNKIKSSFYLSLTAVIWGVAFVFQSMGNNYMEPFTFNSARNFLGFLVLIPLVIIKLKKPELFSGKKEKIVIDKKITIIGGICCGLALAAAGMFQQYGVKYTTVGKAGFITTLYIILTPIFGLLLGKKCHFTVWIGAVGAVAGLYMLCITDGLSFSPGDILVLICAILFAVHISDHSTLCMIGHYIIAVICMNNKFSILSLDLIPVHHTSPPVLP